MTHEVMRKGADRSVMKAMCFMAVVGLGLIRQKKMRAERKHARVADRHGSRHSQCDQESKSRGT